MVFKLAKIAEENGIRFENDVKEYGFQTKNYGGSSMHEFENDVKEYGFQTRYGVSALELCLRMM